jgi:hypothetical protein
VSTQKVAFRNYCGCLVGIAVNPKFVWRFAAGGAYGNAKETTELFNAQRGKSQNCEGVAALANGLITGVC